MQITHTSKYITAALVCLILGAVLSFSYQTFFENKTNRLIRDFYATEVAVSVSPLTK